MELTISFELEENEEIGNLITSKIVECLKGIDPKSMDETFQKIIVNSIDDYDFGDIVYEAMGRYMKDKLREKFVGEKDDN